MSKKKKNRKAKHKTSSVSERQLRANRENALKSTGAKTAEGKDRVSGNALDTGLDARDPKHLVLPDEDPAELVALKEGVMALYKPQNDVESAHLSVYAHCLWLLKRVPRSITKAERDYQDDPEQLDRRLDKIIRSQGRLQRDMRLAMQNFEQVRQARLDEALAAREKARRLELKALAEERRQRHRELSERMLQNLATPEENREYTVLSSTWPFSGDPPDEAEMGLFCKTTQPLPEAGDHDLSEAS